MADLWTKTEVNKKEAHCLTVSWIPGSVLRPLEGSGIYKLNVMTFCACCYVSYGDNVATFSTIYSKIHLKAVSMSP